jgi:hypothetical protein
MKDPLHILDGARRRKATPWDCALIVSLSVIAQAVTSAPKVLASKSLIALNMTIVRL